jgi:hypothetical protein
MPVKFKTGRFTAKTSTGTQDISGVGFQPQIVLFFMAPTTAAGNAVKAEMGIGCATDASNQNYRAHAQSDGSPIYANSRLSNSSCIAIYLAGSTPSLACVADYVTSLADGFRLNWGSADGTAYAIDYVALAGLTNVKIHNFTIPNSTGNNSVTGVGFQPTAAIFYSTGFLTTTSLPASKSLITCSVGFADGTTQFCNAINSRDGGVSASRRAETDSVIFGLNYDNSDWYEGELVSFDADGFTINWKNVTSGTRRATAICFDALNIKVGSDTQKTSTGTKKTTTNNRPVGVLLCSANTDNSEYTETGACRLQVGAFDPTSQFSRWMGRTQGNPAPSDQANATDRCLAFWDEGTPTLTADADVSSRDADGFTLDWKTADTTARRFNWMSFAGADVPIAGSVDAKSGVSGALGASVPVSGAIAAQSGIAGALSADVPISGAVAAQSVVTGIPTLEKPLMGIIAAQSGVAGDATIAGALAGEVAAKSGVSGDISAEVPLAGSIDAVSGVSGTLGADVPLAGTIAALSGVAGDSTIASALSGSIDAQAGVSGQAQGAWAADGAIAGQSGVTGKADAQWAGSGTVAAQSGVAGNITCLVPLSGSISAQSGVGGEAQAQKPLRGVVAAAGVVTGRVDKDSPLMGTISGFSGLTGWASGDKPLAGSIIGLSGVDGEAQVAVPLSGSIAASSDVVGDLRAACALAGSINGKGIVEGTAILYHLIQGSIDGIATVSGRLAADFALSGSLVCHSEITGTLTTPISGAIAGHSHISGALRKLGVPLEVGWGGRVLIPRGEGVGGRVSQLKRTLG